jgi:hypothetical protein
MPTSQVCLLLCIPYGTMRNEAQADNRRYVIISTMSACSAVYPQNRLVTVHYRALVFTLTCFSFCTSVSLVN